MTQTLIFEDTTSFGTAGIDRNTPYGEAVYQQRITEVAKKIKEQGLDETLEDQLASAMQSQAIGQATEIIEPALKQSVEIVKGVARKVMINGEKTGTEYELDSNNTMITADDGTKSLLKTEVERDKTRDQIMEEAMQKILAEGTVVQENGSSKTIQLKDGRQVRVRASDNKMPLEVGEDGKIVNGTVEFIEDGVKYEYRIDAGVITDIEQEFDRAVGLDEASRLLNLVRDEKKIEQEKARADYWNLVQKQTTQQITDPAIRAVAESMLDGVAESKLPVDVEVVTASKPTLDTGYIAGIRAQFFDKTISSFSSPTDEKNNQAVVVDPYNQGGSVSAQYGQSITIPWTGVSIGAVVQGTAPVLGAGTISVGGNIKVADRQGTTKAKYQITLGKVVDKELGDATQIKIYGDSLSSLPDVNGDAVNNANWNRKEIVITIKKGTAKEEVASKVSDVLNKIPMDFPETLPAGLPTMIVSLYEEANGEGQ